MLFALRANAGDRTEVLPLRPEYRALGAQREVRKTYTCI